MRALLRFATPILLPVICLSACKAGTPANSSPQTPLTTVSAPTGGKIVYGSVAGVTTQPAALAKMLSMVHTNSGEKPVIGKPFQFKGTNSVGVFFTVTDHPDGNLPLAGMVIATSTGTNQVQAGMIYDLASRFSQTVNPMLQQLTGAWHPGATPTGAVSQGGMSMAAAGGSTAGLPAGMHTVSLQDGTASVSIPTGWTVDPQSGGGTMLIHGTHGGDSHSRQHVPGGGPQRVEGAREASQGADRLLEQRRPREVFRGSDTAISEVEQHGASSDSDPKR